MFRNTTFVSPSWEYSVSEKNSIQVQYSFVETRYDEPGFSVSGHDYIKRINFADFRQQNYSGSLLHSFTESDTVSFTVSLSDYDGEGNGFLFDSLALFNLVVVAIEQTTKYRTTAYNIGYSHRFTETQKLELRAGVNEVETEQASREHAILIAGGNNQVKPWVTVDSERHGSQYKLSYEYDSENDFNWILKVKFR